jgi:carboxymethylenebutenolidase
VDHAFHNDTNAARYNADAALRAWKRTLAFFERELGN